MKSRPTSWVTAGGEEVFAGDHVALARNRDAVGRIVGAADADELLCVELVEGPERGRTVLVDPAEMLIKVWR
ncbi:hypothetical protein [Catellatospora vulcania]|uniref:hypothetical protein n=1 Tax=Catellatospora vulcania TaxID=1460450 RepID=UPI0012D4A3C5|nr:hypothetical protein [Catellatospora vulcania]